jgi:hypothetical protein
MKILSVYIIDQLLTLARSDYLNVDVSQTNH